MDGDLSVVSRYGGGILFDEVNMSIPRVMAAFKGLVSITRRMTNPENAETIIAGHGGLSPQDVVIFAAYNPTGAYQGTTRLNEALLNQFACPLDWNYDHDVESQLIRSVKLLELGENIRAMAEIRTPVSPNMMMEFERHLRNYNLPLATRFFVNHFPDDERGPVSRALEANGSKIVAELLAPSVGQVKAGRGPQGQLRNFAAMNLNKLEGVVDDLRREGDDPEALNAALVALENKRGQS
jgi:MoxR-like ATPase